MDSVGIQAHLLEVQLQHDATWRTLDAAVKQRDLVAGFHGGLVGLAGIAVPVLIATHLPAGTVVLLTLGTLDAAVALIIFIAAYNLRGVQGLRMLQMKQNAAGRHASRMLAGGDVSRAGYFDEPEPSPATVTALRRQLDPMGLTVATTRHYVLADAYLAALCAVATLISVAAALAGLDLTTIGWRVGSVAVLAANALAVAVTWAVRRAVDRSIAGSERATAEAMDARGRALASRGSRAPASD